jgi:hypothetical protein
MAQLFAKGPTMGETMGQLSPARSPSAIHIQIEARWASRALLSKTFPFARFLLQHSERTA